MSNLHCAPNPSTTEQDKSMEDNCKFIGGSSTSEPSDVQHLSNCQSISLSHVSWRCLTGDLQKKSFTMLWWDARMQQHLEVAGGRCSFLLFRRGRWRPGFGLLWGVRVPLPHLAYLGISVVELAYEQFLLFLLL